MKRTGSGCTLIAVLMLLFATSTTQAFVDPPTFSQSAPNSAQPVTVSVRVGVCHTFIYGGAGGIPPLRIERSPGIVDVISPGIIAFDGFCNLPIGEVPFAIGTLAPGDYQVRIWIIDASFNFLETTLVASAPLTVAQGPAQAIPTLGTGAFLMLILLTLAVAIRFLATRGRTLFVMAALLGSATASAQNRRLS